MSENKKLLLSKAISTKMENRNKDIKKDENGDYPVIVGAVNHFTAGGELYVAEEVKEKKKWENRRHIRRVVKKVMSK